MTPNGHASISERLAAYKDSPPSRTPYMRERSTAPALTPFRPDLHPTNTDSIPIDSQLLGMERMASAGEQMRRQTVSPSPSVERPSVGGKRPKAQFQRLTLRSNSPSEARDSEDEANYVSGDVTKDRQFATDYGHRINASDALIADAIQFAAASINLIMHFKQADDHYYR